MANYGPQNTTQKLQSKQPEPHLKRGEFRGSRRRNSSCSNSGTVVAVKRHEYHL